MVSPMQRFRLHMIPDNLLLEPLGYLFADHVCQRRVCDALALLAEKNEKDSAQETAAAVLAYMSGDLRRHIQDEESDLFPSLPVACRFEDDVESLIDCLIHDHVVVLSLAKRIVTHLQKLATSGGKAESPNFPCLVSAFVATTRRHLELEDQVLLPLARRRLSAADFDRIGRAMAARRNIDYPD